MYMSKSSLLLSILLLCSFTAPLLAQNPGKVTLKGTAVDTTGEGLPFATVMLLNPVDSALLNFTRSDDKGVFAFKNVKNAPYLLKISSVGNLPLQQRIAPSATEVNDLGALTVKPISSVLMEVVVKAAKATLSIRGDTIEYDASSFKVPPGSTVEDLLRRLPGIEVDSDGNIKAQGRDVKRVYVDGKTFFGDDPKAATKNLGAETLSKIQVFDEKSEQAKLTGVDDGKKEKAVNLELKEEFKKGAFGKITVAGGTSDRWASRGNYNRFNTKQQFSVIGFANNINETGVNWEDYGEFKGQNTFEDNDNGDFGFGGGSRFFYASNDLLNNFDGRGFTQNYGAGANYNYDHKKNKANLSYVYNQTTLNLDEFANRQTFLNESSIFNTDTLNRRDFRNNHNLTGRWEHTIDSTNTLIIKANSRFSTSDTRSRDRQLFFPEAQEAPVNQLNLDNRTDLGAWRVSSTAIFRHRFKRKGQSFSASAGYNGSQNNGTDNLFSLNDFFNATTPDQQIRQLNNNDNGTQQLKSSLLYTHPLSKVWFSETFYNISHTSNLVDRQTANPDNSRRIDSLSVFYDNRILYNRLGSGIRYSKKALNISIGLAAQQIQLNGEQSVAEGQPLLTRPIARTFNNITPRIDIGYEFPNNLNVSGEYGYSIEEPRLQDLQPVPNVNNPIFRTEGNPNLGVERAHEVEAHIGYWNPAALSNVGFNINAKFFDSQIVYNQTIEPAERNARIITRPDNADGGYEIGTYLWSNFPIIKTKLTMNLSGNARSTLSPAFVNSVPNDTRSDNYNIRVGFNATPSPKIIIGANANVGLNNIRYSIREDLDQNIQNHGVEGSVKWQFASKFFLESNFNYRIFINDRFDFNQRIPIWNASVRRLLGKDNRIETRLAAFDLLNRRVNIVQRGTQNYVTRSVANTLARYFMLSVSYNVRGYENKLKKDRW